MKHQAAIPTAVATIILGNLRAHPPKRLWITTFGRVEKRSCARRFTSASGRCQIRARTDCRQAGLSQVLIFPSVQGIDTLLLVGRQGRSCAGAQRLLPGGAEPEKPEREVGGNECGRGPDYRANVDSQNGPAVHVPSPLSMTRSFWRTCFAISRIAWRWTGEASPQPGPYFAMCCASTSVL